MPFPHLNELAATACVLLSRGSTCPFEQIALVGVLEASPLRVRRAASRAAMFSDSLLFDDLAKFDVDCSILRLVKKPLKHFLKCNYQLESPLPVPWLLPDGSFMLNNSEILVPRLTTATNMAIFVACGIQNESHNSAGQTPGEIRVALPCGVAVEACALDFLSSSFLGRPHFSSFPDAWGTQASELIFAGVHCDVDVLLRACTSADRAQARSLCENLTLSSQCYFNDVCFREIGPFSVDHRADSFANFIRVATRLTTLDVSGLRPFNNCHVEALCSSQPPLRVLKIARTSCTAAVLAKLVPFIDLLEILDASQLSADLPSGSVHSQHQVQLAVLGKLRILDLSHTPASCSYAVRASALSLSTLAVAGSCSAHVLGGLDPVENGILTTYPRLERLVVTGCVALAEEVLIRAVSNLPVLHSLYADRCCAATDRLLLALSATAGLRLRALRISALAGVSELFPAASNLLEARMITDAGVGALLEHCLNLEELSLAGRLAVTDAAFASFITSGPRALRLLDLACTSVTKLPSLLSETLIAVQDLDISTTEIQCLVDKQSDYSERTSHLQRLAIRKCLFLDCAMLKSMLPCLRYLRELDMRELRPSCIDDAFINKLTGTCTRLEVLKVRGVPRVTNLSLDTFTTSCTFLRVLFLEGVALRPDVARFAAFGTALVFLEVFSLGLCPAVDYASLEALLSSAPRLGSGGHLMLGSFSRLILSDLRQAFAKTKIY